MGPLFFIHHEPLQAGGDAGPQRGVVQHQLNVSRQGVTAGQFTHQSQQLQAGGDARPQRGVVQYQLDVGRQRVAAGQFAHPGQ
ncbi:hypothetical protein KAM461_04920 [Aeromonas hydrophila]|nr:hypothetical protein KAM461_04920 [Aeromonas hydrophila]